jgi:hypothetical protein
MKVLAGTPKALLAEANTEIHQGAVIAQVT